MSTLIAIGATIVDKDQILTVDYRDGKAAVTLRNGQTWTWANEVPVRRALDPWLATTGDEGTIALLRRLLVEQRAQAIRADDKIGLFHRARIATQGHYRAQAESWVRQQLGEDEAA